MTAGQPGRQEITRLWPERPRARPHPVPASHSGPGLLRPAPMGLNLSLSLSAPSCFPSEAENGSLVTNMASGHWVMCALFSLPRSTKGPFVPLPAPLRLCPGPPPRASRPTLRPWAARSDRGLAVAPALSRGRAGAGPCGRGHLGSGRSRQAVEAAARGWGAPCRPGCTSWPP